MLFDYNFKYYNYRLVLYMVALSVIGILVVASASGQDSSTVTKQIIGILVGFALAIGLSIIDYHRIINLYALDYAVCILLLGAVLVMGHTEGGATRWIDVPGIGRIQPSEFVKIGLIVFLRSRTYPPVWLSLSSYSVWCIQLASVTAGSAACLRLPYLQAHYLSIC